MKIIFFGNLSNRLDWQFLDNAATYNWIFILDMGDVGGGMGACYWARALLACHWVISEGWPRGQSLPPSNTLHHIGLEKIQPTAKMRLSVHPTVTQRFLL